MPVSMRQTMFVPPSVVVAAEVLGFFHQAGLEVATVLTASSAQQRAQLLEEGMDIGVTAIDNLVIWNRAGADLRVLAQVERTTPLRLVARAAIGSLEALRGATIGVDAVDNGFAIVLRHLLQDAGLGPQHYRFSPVGGVRERYEALRAGEVAATLLGPPLDEMARVEGFATVAAVEEVIPDFPGQGLVARASRVAQAPEAFTRYLSCLEQARQWLLAAPTEQVVELLTQAGYGPSSARAALDLVPSTLVPSQVGLERLLVMREQLGLGPVPRVGDLYDAGALAEGLKA